MIVSDLVRTVLLGACAAVVAVGLSAYAVYALVALA